MKVELVSEGAPECPLVRFYSNDPSEFCRLRDLARSLAEQEELWKDLATTEGFALLGLHAARLTNTDNAGMVEEKNGSLKWSLSPDAWEGVSELIDPLCSPTAAESFQWLDEAGGFCSRGLTVLASVSDHGRW
jgi:hypothetical protein